MSSLNILKIPPCVLFCAKIKLDELEKLLEPYIVALSPNEEKTFIKMDAESMEFLKRSQSYAAGNVQLFPAFRDEALFKKEYFIAQELWTLTRRINHIYNCLYNMGTLAGNNALESAMAFYNTVKIAAKRDIPGAKAIFEDLKLSFRIKNRKRQKPGQQSGKSQPELFEGL